MNERYMYEILKENLNSNSMYSRTGWRYNRKESNAHITHGVSFIKGDLDERNIKVETTKKQKLKKKTRKEMET